MDLISLKVFGRRSRYHLGLPAKNSEVENDVIQCWWLYRTGMNS